MGYQTWSKRELLTLFNEVEAQRKGGASTVEEIKNSVLAVLQSDKSPHAVGMYVTMVNGWFDGQRHRQFRKSGYALFRQWWRQKYATDPPRFKNVIDKTPKKDPDEPAVKALQSVVPKSEEQEKHIEAEEKKVLEKIEDAKLARGEIVELDFSFKFKGNPLELKRVFIGAFRTALSTYSNGDK